MIVHCDKLISTPTEEVRNCYVSLNRCNGLCDEIDSYVDQQGYHHWYECRECGYVFQRLR